MFICFKLRAVGWRQNGLVIIYTKKSQIQKDNQEQIDSRQGLMFGERTTPSNIIVCPMRFVNLHH